jgi:hypothetical protein
VTCTHPNPVYVHGQCSEEALLAVNGDEVVVICNLADEHPGDHWDFFDGHWHADGIHAVPGTCGGAS